MMSQNNSQLHQQHMNATRLNTTADTTVSMQDDSDEMQEVIEVQILPQVSFILKYWLYIYIYIRDAQHQNNKDM